MHKLNYEKHKNLIDKCISGDICLFTGSGFSMGGRIKSHSIFSTDDLIDSLLREFVGLEKPEQITRLKKRTFQQICQYTIDEKTEDSFNDFITEKFQNCIPANFHYKYAKIDWKDIFTTNIDDLLEEIYKKTKIRVQSFNTKKQPDDYVGSDIMKYYKLHGDVKNKSEGFIFSTKQYVDTVIDNKLNYPMLKFSEQLYKDTFCFIGSNFNEIDIEKYISSFQKQHTQHLPKNKIYFISKYIHDEDMAMYQSRNIIPIQETAENFIDKILEFKDKNINSNSGLKIVKKVSAYIKLEKMGFDCVSKDCLGISEEQITRHKPVDFYVGYSPKWLDIASASDAIFKYTSNIINQIEDDSNFNLYTIIGKSGNGKSTALKRILYNFSDNDDYIVVEHKELNEINNNVINDLIKLINIEKKHIIFGFDNGSWSFKFIERIYNKIDSKKVSFIITTRYPEFYRERTYISGLPQEPIYIDDNLNYQNASCIIDILDNKGYLGDLQKFITKEEKIKEFLNLKSKNKDLFTSLIYTTKGKGFFKRINEHIDSALQESSIKVKILLLLALLDRFGSLDLSKSIFFNVFRLEIKDFSILLQGLSDILDKRFESNDYIKLRGEYATDYILKEIHKYIDNDDIFNVVSKVLMYTSTLYDVDKRKKRSYKTELSSLLLNSRYYINYLKIKDRRHYSNFYNSLKNYYKNLAPFWLYYAKMEMKLHDLDSAWIHLKQAKSLNDSYEIEHTIGQWYLIHSRTISSYSEAYNEFKQGEEIMINQIRSGKDAYPVHTYIEEYIFFNTRFNKKNNNSEIKSLIKIINDARKTFNDQVIIQIIWKKFYNFLGRIKLKKLMRLSLNDLELMDKIDLNKSAEEQYFLLLKNKTVKI